MAVTGLVQRNIQMAQQAVFPVGFGLPVPDAIEKCFQNDYSR